MNKNKLIENESIVWFNPETDELIQQSQCSTCGAITIEIIGE
jgi:hypothetical protein